MEEEKLAWANHQAIIRTLRKFGCLNKPNSDLCERLLSGEEVFSKELDWKFLINKKTRIAFKQEAIKKGKELLKIRSPVKKMILEKKKELLGTHKVVL